MKKVLITGISGFVGQNLSKYLKKEYEIIGVGRNEELNYNNFSEVKYDIIVHLAGKAHDLKNVSNVDEYYEANFDLTKRVFDVFLKSDAEKFIYLSSIKAVADEVEDILSEETIPNPKTHYGYSKLLAEKYIYTSVNTKKVYILRPCIIHGKGNKGNLNLLYRMIKKGIPYPLGAFHNERSFLSVSNLCFIINEILVNDLIPTGIYNVADSGTVSTNRLIKIINSALGKNVSIIKVSKKVITLVAKLGDFFKLPLNTDMLKKLTANYVVSNKKIIYAIQKELPVDIEEGLLNTFITFE